MYSHGCQLKRYNSWPEIRDSHKGDQCVLIYVDFILHVVIWYKDTVYYVPSVEATWDTRGSGSPRHHSILSSVSFGMSTGLVSARRTETMGVCGTTGFLSLPPRPPLVWRQGTWRGHLAPHNRGHMGSVGRCSSLSMSLLLHRLFSRS